MSRVTVIRTDQPMPGEGILSGVRNFLFGLFDGWRNDDKKGWRRIWRRLIDLEPGEFAVISAALLFFWAAGAIAGPWIAATVMGWFGPKSMFAVTAVTQAAFLTYTVTRKLQRPV